MVAHGVATDSVGVICSTCLQSANRRSNQDFMGARATNSNTGGTNTTSLLCCPCSSMSGRSNDCSCTNLDALHLFIMSGNLLVHVVHLYFRQQRRINKYNEETTALSKRHGLLLCWIHPCGCNHACELVTMDMTIANEDTSCYS
mmetsp:Transcript_3148/g.5808  ORF Transcript_3148/g.5808 Transcript_3148/m.5808 type:complete len:144 (+) Transcript_3148:672-1103(+)